MSNLWPADLMWHSSNLNAAATSYIFIICLKQNRSGNYLHTNTRHCKILPDLLKIARPSALFCGVFAFVKRRYTLAIFSICGFCQHVPMCEKTSNNGDGSKHEETKTLQRRSHISRRITIYDDGQLFFYHESR